MINPVEYSRTNQCIQLTTYEKLRKYGHLIQWSGTGKDTVMDAGCGPGNVSVEVIYPRVKGESSKIYAVDICEQMIAECKRTSKDVPEIETILMDIDSAKEVEAFVQKYGPVNHVISSFLLHWLKDHDQGLKNIFNLLTPGGDFFSVHFQSCIVFPMYKLIQESDKWGKYFNNLERHIPPAASEEHTETDLYKSLEIAGFVNTFVALNHSYWAIPPRDFPILMRSVHQQIENIPKEKLDEYMEDYWQIAVENKLARVTPNGEYEFAFNPFVCYGRRPRAAKCELKK